MTGLFFGYIIDPYDSEGKVTLLFLLSTGFFIWLSLALIVRLWIKHKKASLPKKIFWTLVLIIPSIGPIFYAAFFKRPGLHNIGGGGGSGGMPAGGASA